MRDLALKWDRFWFAPQPVRVFCCLRVITGLLLMFYMSDKLFYYREFLSVEGYHLPNLSLGYHQLVYLPPMSVVGAKVFTGVFIALMLAFTAGLWTRSTTVILAFLHFSVWMIDTMSSFTINKIFMMTLVFLSFCPSGAFYSVDAALRRRRHPEAQVAESMEGWVYRVFQITLVLAYFVAGMCKVLPSHGHWLTNRDLLQIQVGGVYQTDAAFALMQVTPAWGWTLQQYIALGFELLAPILLIIPSTRWIAIVWGSGFHLIIALTMHMLLPFSLQMMSFYIFFLPREWFFGDSRALLRTLRAIPLFSRRGGAAEQGV